MKNNFYQVSFFCFFKTELLIWFFAEESAVKGFIDGSVYDTSCRLLRRTTKLLSFSQSRYLSVSEAQQQGEKSVHAYCSQCEQRH